MKFNSKKASANMWWIIIGAVIALVVMIILMVMFTDKGQSVESGLSGCESKGGVCSSIQGVCPAKSLESGTFSCKNDGETCCIGAPQKCVGDTECSGGQVCRSFGSNRNYCVSEKELN